ncbi:MAG: rRNA pseudouridine synthase, partial [Firmicutes bacterium]|nr:rRNA pseudouridine synthase [Candidatus Colimorpha enterica]
MSGSESVKLQKYVADCGLMSRRAAEERIADGSIKVNGETVELGRRIVPGTDSVTFNGKPVAITGKKRYAYIMLNKPKGYVTSMNDELGRQCVRDLTEDVGVRVYPCGRLDKDSEGLLIMTNDGDLAEKLMHPKHHIPKYYTVRVEGKITEKQLKTLN